MLVHDEIYGSEAIEEPILQELLESEPLDRLRGVLQHGISGLIGLTPPVTRYEHSLGVMRLVRRLGGGLQEQIAALLHDVSHTAFSHVMDHVFDSAGSQAFHERVKAGFLKQTAVPGILAGYGFDWQDFLDEEAYPLLEQPAPALCADRIDYFMRDALAFELATPAQVGRLLDHLVVHDGRIALNDLNVARWLGETFMRADDHSWSNFNEVGLYELTAQALRAAFQGGYLRPEDIWLTDQELWERLKRNNQPELEPLVARIHPNVRFTWDADRPTFVLQTKIRTIDPDVVHNDDVRPLSAWDPSFARQRHAYLRRKSGPWPMRLQDGERGMGDGE